MRYSYLKMYAVSLALIVTLFGCAAANESTSADNQISNEQVVEVVLLTKLIDEVRVALAIEPQVTYVVGEDVSDAFIRNGWRKVEVTDADREIDMMCQLDSDDFTVIAKCKVDGSIEINGKALVMPTSYGYMTFDKTVMDANRFKQSLVDLIMIQEMDAADSGERKIIAAEQK